MEIIFRTIIPVLFIILIGYAIGKRKKIDIDPFINLILYITAPFLVFTSMAKSSLSSTDLWSVILVAFCVYLIQGTIAFFSFRKHKGLIVSSTAGNTGYLGYPIAYFAFGDLGLSLAVLFDIIGTLLLFSIGVYLLHHENKIGEMFRMPILYAVIIGLVHTFFPFPVYPPLFAGMEMIGAITLPLALLILGYRLTSITVKSFRLTLAVSLYKVLFGFALCFGFVSLFAIESTTRSVLLLQASMPAAVLSMILAAKYKRDAAKSASVIFISTLLSIITIPLILFFFT